MIYLDTAATALKRPPEVIEAVTFAMQNVASSARGYGEPGLAASRLLYRTRLALSAFFGIAKPEQVIFTSNATEALNTVIAGAILPHSHIISTVSEHNSVLRPLFRLQKEQQNELTFIGLDASGALDYTALADSIRPDTTAIVVNHASNVTGRIADLKRIGQIAAKHNLFYIVDAAQTAGSLPINCRELGIDALCFTGHKGLMGPQGTGGICLSERITVRPLKTGGTGSKSKSATQPEELPDRLEAGTLNIHGIAGLKAALSFLEATGLQTIRNREIELTDRFLKGAKAIEHINLLDLSFASERTSVVSLNIVGEEPSAVADRLSYEYGISTRAGLHCAPLMHEALGTGETGAIRFSFNFYTTEDDIDTALSALEEIAR